MGKKSIEKFNSPTSSQISNDNIYTSQISNDDKEEDEGLSTGLIIEFV